MYFLKIVKAPLTGALTYQLNKIKCRLVAEQ